MRVVGAEQRIRKGIRETFRNTTNSVVSLWEGVEMLEFLLEKLERNVPKWIGNRMEEAKDVLECLCSSDEKYVRYLHLDTDGLPVLCAASREIPELLQKMLWDREEGVSAILTSGTLKAGADFCAPGRPPGWKQGQECRNMWQSPLFPMRRTVCYTCQRH